MRISWLSAAWLAGCVIDAPDDGNTDDTFDEGPGVGVVEVSWLVGSSGCELNDVTDVQIQIGTFDELIPCETGATRIELQAGDYELVAIGLDVDGVARFEGRDPLVSVFDGETTLVPEVRLSALPASLTLSWFFANQRFCKPNGVASINVALFDNEELVDPFPIDTDCTDGQETFENIPSGSYVVDVLGRTSEGVSTYQATEEIELQRGEAASLEVRLEEREVAKP